MVTFYGEAEMVDMMLRVMLDIAETMGGSGSIGDLTTAQNGKRAIYVEFTSTKRANRWIDYVTSSYGNVKFSRDYNFILLWIE